MSLKPASTSYRDPKQLSETLSLNKIEKWAGNVARWLSAPDFNP